MRFKNDVADECFDEDFEVEPIDLKEACEYLGVPYNMPKKCCDEWSSCDFERTFERALRDSQ